MSMQKVIHTVVEILGTPRKLFFEQLSAGLRKVNSTVDFLHRKFCPRRLVSSRLDLLRGYTALFSF